MKAFQYKVYINDHPVESVGYAWDKQEMKSKLKKQYGEEIIFGYIKKISVGIFK